MLDHEKSVRVEVVVNVTEPVDIRSQDSTSGVFASGVEIDIPDQLKRTVQERPFQ